MKISKLSKGILLLAAVLLIISIFVPIWIIYLDAPQYPEGLDLQIWASRLDGDVDIINGLNHYIGMKTLHSKDFIEFTVLPYIIIAFAILFGITAFAGRKNWVYICFGLFIVFGIAAMVDFWIWEYNYGHNLDPNAAIKVPGMAYQPPLIGYKQLLNFGAYSVPHIGGWLLISAGALLFVAVLLERNILKRKKLRTVRTLSVLAIFSFMISCGSDGPEPIQLNKDACSHCKMSISEGNFAAELITQKGRVYKFDDFLCMNLFVSENQNMEVKNFYVGDYLKENELTDATSAWYVHSEQIKSPMSGHIAAFSNKTEAEEFAKQYETSVQTWNEITSSISSIKTHEHSH